MKLILGTAEFGPKPYGTAKAPVSLNEIREMLQLAKSGGITTLEGAEDYFCDEVVQDSRFDLIYKVRHPYNLNKTLEKLGRSNLMGLLYHHWPTDRGSEVLKDNRLMYTGSSVYFHSQLSGKEDMIEVPLNLDNRVFEKVTAPCKLARSVFGRGELLKQYSPRECLDYVKSVPSVHGVVVGVNNIKELDEVLKAWHT